MDVDERAWRRFVEDFDIEVPESAVEEELHLIELEMRHRMHYDALSGGGPSSFSPVELERRADELREAAVFEAKSARVLAALLDERDFSVSRDELEAEAVALVKRQNSTMEMVRRFFGDDLALLERDVRERKAMAWACEQIGA